MRSISMFIVFLVALIVGPSLVTGWPASPTASSAALAATGEDGVVETDVAYSEINGKPLLLTVFHPLARATPRPAVILIHGGPKWTEGYEDRFSLFREARTLARAGYITFSIDYRLVETRSSEDEVLTDQWPVQLDDVQRAVRWVRANATQYGVDPGRLCAFGPRAGGHLAAMLGVRETRDNTDPTLAAFSSRISCVVAFGSDMDLTIPYSSDFDRELVSDFLGGTMEEVPAAYRDASPITWVDENTAPFLLIYGAQSDDTSIDHARRMTAALQSAGVEVVSVELASTDIMRSLDWNLFDPWTLAFLDRHLRPED